MCVFLNKILKFTRFESVCAFSTVKLTSFHDVEKSEFKKEMFKNPVEELNLYLDVPVFDKNDESVFNPSLEEMKRAHRFFQSRADHKIKFLTSVTDDKFPQHDLPEVTFIGESNVGKSSLLKAILLDVRKLPIIVSKIPGRTRELNFYTVGSKMCIVDVPGYGLRQPEDVMPTLDLYLKSRNNLKKTFLLIDSRRGIQESDEEAMEKLEGFGISYCLVLTKIDRANKGVRLKRLLLSLQKIRDKSEGSHCFPQPFLVSSLSGAGIAYFQSFLTHVVGIKLEEHRPSPKKVLQLKI